jgi:hypothetical protein
VEVVKALVTLRLSSQLEYRKYLSFSISNKYLCIGLKRKTVKLSLMILKSFYFGIKNRNVRKYETILRYKSATFCSRIIFKIASGLFQFSYERKYQILTTNWQMNNFS